MAFSAFLKLIFSNDLQTQYDSILEFSFSHSALARRGLLFGIRDKNAEVRARAANALAFHGGKAVVKALIKALDDTEIKVRSFALDSLAAVGDLRAIKPMAILLGDRDERVRLSAASALREFVKKNQKQRKYLIR
jgi:HEAT repeat protein